jgi:hypothetical protein|tara:strand:- start:462 stop:668 length:207 start_codon:yes stop_codon:yes gene_type:complete
MTIKAGNFKGFNAGELIDYLKKIPKKSRLVIYQGGMHGEQPLNVIQEPEEATLIGKALCFNSFYEDEF